MPLLLIEYDPNLSKTLKFKIGSPEIGMIS